MWLHELVTDWPIFVIIGLVAVWAETSRRANFKRHMRQTKEVEDAYERGREDANAKRSP